MVLCPLGAVNQIFAGCGVNALSGLQRAILRPPLISNYTISTGSLVIAGLLEVVWAVGLKYTHGFSRLTPSVITVTAMIVSMALLAWAMKSLPVGTAYAVWTGIGAVGAAITGIVSPKSRKVCLMLRLISCRRNSGSG